MKVIKAADVCDKEPLKSTKMEYREALEVLIKCADVKALEDFLKHAKDENNRLDNGNTLLHQAVEAEDITMVRLLLERGASI